MRSFLTLFFLLPSLVWGQTIDNRDAQISRAIKEISVPNMKQTVDDLVGFHTRNNLSSTSDSKTGIGAAANYLYAKLNDYAKNTGGRMSVEKVTYKATAPRSENELELVNIVATIHGSDSRVVALLAHYDSRGGNGNDGSAFAPGANDDGSGVAALLEIARIVSKQPLGATLKLMFLSGEEHGLWGARYMAKIAAEQQWNLIAVINNDMIGNAEGSETATHDNTTVRIFSEGIPAVENEAQRQQRTYNAAENDAPARQLARYVKEVGERYVENITVQLIYRADRFGRGGDHTPFSREGFSAVRLTEVNENYDRTHQDVAERDGIRYGDMPWGIDWEYLRKNTGVNLASAFNLALAPFAPEHVKIDNASRLSNIIELSWQPPQLGKTPKGYYVLVRRTDISTWERKIFTTDSHISLPLSKDNYFFAVQSVDEDGHESLSIFALAAR